MQTRTEIGYNSKIEGDVIHTRLDAALNWFRKHSLWPMPMGLACCAIEMMAAGASRFEDRKSTRLNSSHTVISYAVFCLKKKKNKKKTSEHQKIDSEYTADRQTHASLDERVPHE